MGEQRCPALGNSGSIKPWSWGFLPQIRSVALGNHLILGVAVVVRLPFGEGAPCSGCWWVPGPV